MDQQIDTDLDQADEDILTYTVSDEALEAAARSTVQWTPVTLTPYQTIHGAAAPSCGKHLPR